MASIPYNLARKQVGDTQKRGKPEMRSSCSNSLDLHWSARPQPGRGSALVSPTSDACQSVAILIEKTPLSCGCLKVSFSDGLAGPTSPWACSCEPRRRITAEQSKEKPSWHRSQPMTDEYSNPTHNPPSSGQGAYTKTHTRACAHTHTHTHTHARARACTHTSRSRNR